MAAAFNFRSKSLRGFTKGDFGKIKGYTNERIAAKLISMGFLPGNQLQLIRKAPFGGAFYVKSGSYVIALREKEAACILMLTEGKA